MMIKALRKTLLATSLVLAAGSPARLYADPAGWTKVWSDEFDGSTLDLTKWTPESTNNPQNNERQAYLPQQITVSGGNMVITSENIPVGNKQYRSGRVHSKYTQQHGRWEIRADLPGTKGMWPAIWLLPDTTKYNWPSQGEVDIMENRGNQPTLTSSAYHFGTNPPFFHDYRTSEQTTSVMGDAVNYHTGFHTYAVEWDASKVRFFVDDVNHWTVYNSDTNGYLASQTAPMWTMLNAAIGGDFLGSQQPDGTSVWPQQFLIDYVRIYEKNDDPITFRNGGFEENGGSLAGWTEFGNRVNRNNVAAQDEAVAAGDASLKLYGGGLGGVTYSGVSQGITVAAGDEVQAAAQSFISSQSSLAGTTNSVQMKIEFYNEFGGNHDSAALLKEVSATIADGSTTNDMWLPHDLSAVAPAGAVEARLSFVFTEPGTAGGAVHIDNVSFANPRIETPAGDADGDGDVDADDVSMWREQYGSESDFAADFDQDGDVDGADFLVWQHNLGRGVAPPSTASTLAVPEPWGVAMALAALVQLLRSPGAVDAP